MYEVKIRGATRSLFSPSKIYPGLFSESRKIFVALDCDRLSLSTSNVSVKSLDEKKNITYTYTQQQYDNNIIISATVIGLLLIGMGISIKFYLDKVKSKYFKQNADRFANFSIEFLK